MRRMVIVIVMVVFVNGLVVVVLIFEVVMWVLQVYVVVVVCVMIFVDFKGYWLMCFVGMNEGLYVQQLWLLLVEMCVWLEKNLLWVVVDNVVGVLKIVLVICVVVCCMVCVKLFFGVMQIYWLVEEGGLMVIDDVNMVVGLQVLEQCCVLSWCSLILGCDYVFGLCFVCVCQLFVVFMLYYVLWFVVEFDVLCGWLVLQCEGFQVVGQVGLYIFGVQLFGWVVVEVYLGYEVVGQYYLG